MPFAEGLVAALYLCTLHVPVPDLAGTGKSTYINKHLVQGLPKESWAPIFITFSARTTANMAQEQVHVPPSFFEHAMTQEMAKQFDCLLCEAL